MTSWTSESFDGLDCCIALFPPWPLFASIACRGGVVGDHAASLWLAALVRNHDLLAVSAASETT
jgi:hypothetical protein